VRATVRKDLLGQAEQAELMCVYQLKSLGGVYGFSAGNKPKELGKLVNNDQNRVTVGDQVPLSTQNIKLSLLGTKGFHPLKGSLIIELVGPVAARLQLPAHWIHNVFHVSHLSRYKPDGKVAFVPPAAFLQEGGEKQLELTPSCIVADQKKAGKRCFLVSFKDMGPEFNQWVPKSTLQDYPLLLASYLNQSTT
jgi:hypothetical protein